jgi:glutamyl-tRNA reductase
VIVCLSAGRDAPEAVRELLVPTSERLEELLAERHPGLTELVVVSTCHRVEFYAAAEGSEADAVWHLRELLPELQVELQAEITVLRGAEALEHLFRVTAGLDSLVIGEPQIQGQIRRSLRFATEAGSAGPLLTTVFSHSLHLAKRIRSQTRLGGITGSIGSAAATAIEARLGPLDRLTGVIVGAGEAAEDVATAAELAELTIVSRTETHAADLANRVGAGVVPWDTRSRALRTADFVVVAVSGGPLIGPEHLGEARPLLVDLSMPHAIDPSLNPLRIDDLPVPRGDDIEDAVATAELYIAEEIASLERWYDTREDAGRDARMIRSAADSILREEFSEAHLTVGDAERFEPNARREINRLLHEPLVRARMGEGIHLDTDALRQAIRQVLATASGEL